MQSHRISYSLVHLWPLWITTGSNRWQSGETGASYGPNMSTYETAIRDRVRIALASPPRLIDQLVRLTKG